MRFRQESGGQVRFTAEGHACRFKVSVADGQDADATVSVAMRDAVVDAGDERPATTATRRPRPRSTGSSPSPCRRTWPAMADRTAEQYLRPPRRATRAARAQRLRFAWFDLTNHISSELNARAAFVVSCLLLVLVGSSLGMMFRSGNFLTAFAVSVVPAMLSTVLIVTGQHTAESTPDAGHAGQQPPPPGPGHHLVRQRRDRHRRRGAARPPAAAVKHVGCAS